MLILYSCTERECGVCVTEDSGCCFMREFYYFFPQKIKVRRLEGKFWKKKKNHLIHSMFAKICITVTLLWLGLFTVLRLACSQSSSDISTGATKDYCKGIFHPKLKIQSLYSPVCLFKSN